MLPGEVADAVGAHHQGVGSEVAEAQEGRPVFGDDQRDREAERHHPRAVHQRVGQQQRAGDRLRQHQAEAGRHGLPGALEAGSHAHRVTEAAFQPLARGADRRAGDQEAERRGGEEMDHRHEEMQQCRHHRPDQAGDAVGRVEQAVDRLLAVAVAHQRRDGRLQRRREHHAERRQPDRGDDQQGDRQAGGVVADHRQEAEGGTPPARDQHRLHGTPAVEQHAAEQAGDQHGDVLHAGDQAHHVAGDLDREPHARHPEQVLADRRGAEPGPDGEDRTIPQRAEDGEHQGLMHLSPCVIPSVARDPSGNRIDPSLRSG